MERLFSQVKKEFVNSLDVRANSRALYSRILNQFAKWVVTTGRNIKVLKRSDILSYKSALLELT